MTAIWNRTRLLTAAAGLLLAASLRAGEPAPDPARPKPAPPPLIDLPPNLDGPPAPIFVEPRAPSLLSRPLPPVEQPAPPTPAPAPAATENRSNWTAKPTPPSVRSPYQHAGAESRYSLTNTAEPSDYLPSELQQGRPTGGIVPGPELQFGPPLGFSGPSSVIPRSGASRDFITIEDRWRIGFPEWDRYNKGQPTVNDYPYELGRIYDPF